MDTLWVDKHRPKNLELLDHNKQLTSTLKKLSGSVDLPHLLFYGPNGAGKKTRIMAFLSELYGNGVYKLKPDHWEFKASATSSTKIECAVLSSNYHIDITPSDVENYDRVVLQKLIKEVASSEQLNTKSQRSFKIVVINEVDRLTREAQAALRRTMEKYVATCRLILCCENVGKVIQPLRSRCLLLRVAAPQHDVIGGVIRKIAKKENVQISDKLISRLCVDSERNLRRAILQFQTLRMQSHQLNDNQALHSPEWREAIKTISKDILHEQTPTQLKAIREKVYDLLVNCVPGEVIIKSVMMDLMSSIDDDIKFEAIHWAAYHENKLQKGSKPIFHIEAFISRMMLLYKRFCLSLGI